MGLMPEITARDYPVHGLLLWHRYPRRTISVRRSSRIVTARRSARRNARSPMTGRDDPLLAGMPAGFTAFVGHKEAVQELPEAARICCCPVRARSR